VFEALRRIFIGSPKASKSNARNRLQFVLVQDRAGLTNEEMTAFKKELVEVIEKYFVIDEQGFDIDYQRNSDNTVLLINSPVIVKRAQAGGKTGEAIHKNRSRKNRNRASARAAANISS